MSTHPTTHASPQDFLHHPANLTFDPHGESDTPNHTHNSTSQRDTHPDRVPRPPTIYNSRPNRIKFRKNEDIHALQSYGNSIHQVKDALALRIYFQNIKGLSFRTDNDDYSYVMTNLADLQADIVGLAETNTSWQHGFLRQSFSAAVRKHGTKIAKISFASPSKQRSKQGDPRQSYWDHGPPPASERISRILPAWDAGPAYISGENAETR